MPVQQSQRQNTKAALIEAAERLFAEKGLGGVSVKEIIRAAGARNESALQYHFGSVDELIKEVFANRYREIEQARAASFSALRFTDSDDKLEVVLEAALMPFMAACLSRDGRLYALFCAQIATDPRFDLFEIINGIGMPSLATLRGFVVASIQGVPEHILATRLRRSFTISLLIAADYAQQIELGVAPPIEEATREAVVTLAAFLRAKLTMPKPRASKSAS
jgi:AcrR family transcriptional regulator